MPLVFDSGRHSSINDQIALSAGVSRYFHRSAILLWNDELTLSKQRCVSTLALQTQ